jgi:CPA1 family monovalent cation:H+ antiporter
MAGGIYMSSRSTQIFDADSRIAAAYTWNLLFFVFNGAAFVLIGLQLPSIVRSLAAYSLATVIGWSLAIALIVVVVRYVWMFPAAYGRRRLWPKIREREGPDPPWQQVFVLSTAGMRGIVSLAAALALPETIAPGVAFPQRSLILFITFVVILVTLVGEGLALPWLIRRLGVTSAEDEGRTVAAARARLAEAGRAHLRALESSFASTAEWEIAGRLHASYELRVAHFTAHAGGTEPDDDAQQHEIERRLRREAFDAERRTLQEMRRGGEVTDDLYRHLQWDLDLAESQLE